jgi:hypothetical protein
MSLLFLIPTLALLIGLVVLVYAVIHAPEGAESEMGFNLKAKSKGKRLRPISGNILKSAVRHSQRISAA